MRNILSVVLVCGGMVSFTTLQRRLWMEEAVLGSNQSLLPSTVIHSKPIIASDDDTTHIEFLLNTFNTTLLAQGPYQEMQSFLQEHPNTAGSRFIHLLQSELFGRPEWEPHRQTYCERTLPLCIGGYHNANVKMSTSNTSSSSSIPRFSTTLDRVYNYYNHREHETYLPLLPPSDFTSVYRVRHFRRTNHTIINLGTNKVCLPLFLAAASIDPYHGIVVELGPFTGFSSKCAAYGVQAAALQHNNNNQKTNHDDNNTNHNNNSDSSHNKISATTTSRLVSFDTFEGTVNLDAIIRRQKGTWVKDVYPNLTQQNSNFVKLWQDTVQDVYPPATAIAGYINTSVVTDERIQQISAFLSSSSSSTTTTTTVTTTQVLLVDTVKTSKLLHEHLGGITLHVGTILFLMDFQRTKDLIQQVYGCFRQHYLLPIYISWNNEHTAFVVTRTFTMKDHEIFQCYQTLATVNFQTTPYHIHHMKAQVKQDLMFLSGLTTQANIHERYRVNLRDKTLPVLNRAIEEQDEWTWRILSGLANRS
jgi:hypothetical protein